MVNKKYKAEQLISELKKYIKKDKANILARFFKTGPGQYGEGDVFIGVMVPQVRQVANRFYQQINLTEIKKLLNNKVHEVRLLGLLILVRQYGHAKEEKAKKIIFDFYIKNLAKINNWDLVDLTAPKIVGEYLNDKSKAVLYKLAQSKNLWARRVSVLACFAFIKNQQFADILKMAKIHLGDKHDLMHKAVGWMLREVGKHDEKTLLNFLETNVDVMPRTMLRYAIERLPELAKKRYLSIKRKVLT